MIVHIDSAAKGAYPLREQQTRELLRFCRSVGAKLFTVNFLFVKGEESERLSDEFYFRLAPFSAGRKLLECVFGNGFKEQDCWSLTEESIELIVNETAGDLLAYDFLKLPEDWLVYVEDSILLQVVTNEQEITLRVTDAELRAFSDIGIPYTVGQPKYSGLRETPLRTPPVERA